MTDAPPTSPTAEEPPLDVLGTLRLQLRRVMYLRRSRAASAATMAERRRKFTDDNRVLIDDLTRVEQETAAAEAAIRELALAHYRETREKRPTPGVQVKVGTKLTYALDAAFAWAKEKRLALIPEQLDRKAFEHIVKALAERPAFVAAEDVPSAEVASDLDKALAEP